MMTDGNEDGILGGVAGVAPDSCSAGVESAASGSPIVSWGLVEVGTSVATNNDDVSVTNAGMLRESGKVDGDAVSTLVKVVVKDATTDGLLGKMSGTVSVGTEDVELDCEALIGSVGVAGLLSVDDGWSGLDVVGQLGGKTVRPRSARDAGSQGSSGVEVVALGLEVD